MAKSKKTLDPTKLMKKKDIKVPSSLAAAPSSSKNGEEGDNEVVRFTLDIPKSKHRTLKIRTATMGKSSLKDYILEALDYYEKAFPLK